MVSWHTHVFQKPLLQQNREHFRNDPNGFKGLILQGGGSKFWGNIRCILPTHVNIRKRWQVWDEVLGLRLSRSLKLKLQSRQHRKMVRVNVETAMNSALSNHFAARRIRMWSTSFRVCPSLEIQEKRWISFLCNQDPAMLRWCPLQNDSRRFVFTFGVPLPQGPSAVSPCILLLPVKHWSRRESPWGRSYRTAQWQPHGLHSSLTEVSAFSVGAYTTMSDRNPVACLNRGCSSRNMSWTETATRIISVMPTAHHAQ